MIGFLFDLDGVLIDSEREYTRIWSEIDESYPTGIEGFAIKIKGMTLPEILNTYYPDHQLHSEIIDMLNYKEQRMQYEMLPGAESLLNELCKAGIATALVTSSNDIKMRHLREELPELESYFSEIVTADRITHSKPHPEPYLKGAALLNLDAKDCIVIEDSQQGVISGRSSGAYVVGLTTTLSSDKLEPYCDLILPDLSYTNLEKLRKAKSESNSN